MSKNNRVPNKESDTDVKVQETVNEDKHDVEVKSADVVKAEAPKAIDTPEKESLESEVTPKENEKEFVPEPPKEPKIETKAEQPKVLGGSPIDVNTGKTVSPSTPAMRRAAEMAAKKAKIGRKEVLNIEQHVIEKYGEKAAQNVHVKHVIATLHNHVSAMSPGCSMNEKVGGEYQTRLAKMFDSVLRLPPELSQTCLNIILDVVTYHLQGAFGERYMLRFINTAMLDYNASLRFQLLMTMFTTLAETGSKEKLAQKLNLRSLLEHVTDRDSKSNLSEFIN